MVKVSHLRLALLALFLVSVMAELASADIPVPDDPRRPHPAPSTKSVPLTVRRQPTTKQSRIVIPRKLLAGIAAGDQQAAVPWNTVIAGLAMSLAVAAGVVVYRRSRWPKPALAAVLCGACVLATAGVTMADLVLPREAQPVRPRPSIVLEISDQGDEIVLVIGQDFPKK